MRRAKIKLKKVHITLFDNGEGRPACISHPNYKFDAKQLTLDPAQVTCKRCNRMLDR